LEPLPVDAEALDVAKKNNAGGTRKPFGAVMTETGMDFELRVMNYFVED